MKYSQILVLISLLFALVLQSSPAFGQYNSSGVTSQSKGEVSLFNGQNLDEWQTVSPRFQKLWYVQDSAIHCGDEKMTIPENTYLHTKREFENFELRCLFRINGDPSTGMINSGIQYRSFVHDGKLIGYQADIGDGYWGDLYDEHRRGELVNGKTDILKLVLHPEDWNSYTIRVEGNHHQLFINGVQTVDYLEKDSSIPIKGVIAVQNHSGGNSHVEFRDLNLTILP